MNVQHQITSSAKIIFYKIINKNPDSSLKLTPTALQIYFASLISLPELYFQSLIQTFTNKKSEDLEVQDFLSLIFTLIDRFYPQIYLSQLLSQNFVCETFLEHLILSGSDYFDDSQLSVLNLEFSTRNGINLLFDFQNLEGQNIDSISAEELSNDLRRLMNFEKFNAKSESNSIRNQDLENQIIELLGKFRICCDQSTPRKQLKVEKLCTQILGFFFSENTLIFFMTKSAELSENFKNCKIIKSSPILNYLIKIFAVFFSLFKFQSSADYLSKFLVNLKIDYLSFSRSSENILKYVFDFFESNFNENLSISLSFFCVHFEFFN